MNKKTQVNSKMTPSHHERGLESSVDHQNENHKLAQSFGLSIRANKSIPTDDSELSLKTCEVC